MDASAFQVGLTVINGLVLFLLSVIRTDQKDAQKSVKEIHDEMWHRIYNHAHIVDCENDGCAKVTSGAVVVPQEGSCK